MKFAKIIATTLVLGGLAAPAMAEEESSGWGTFSGNVALANDYVFRGISQTMNNATIQGGLDWDSGMGIYIGTWGSNVDFGGADGGMELDVYGGFRGTIGDSLSYDVGAVGYLYPGSVGAANLDYWEAKVVLGYDFGVASVSGSVYYSPDFTGGLGDAVHYSGSISVPIMESLTLSGGVGRQVFSDLTGSDITDFNIGTSYAFPWFTLDVRWTDTDAQFGSLIGVNAKGVHTLNDSRVVAKISRSF